VDGGSIIASMEIPRQQSKPEINNPVVH
jgi:hypothetical protein